MESQSACLDGWKRGPWGSNCKLYEDKCAHHEAMCGDKVIGPLYLNLGTK
jgi:hypothetical protein